MSGTTTAAQGGMMVLALVTAGCVPSSAIHALRPAVTESKTETKTAPTPESRLQAPMKKPPTEPQVVKVGDKTRSLGDIQKALVTRDDFLTRINDLLANQKPTAARHFIERYPDVALDALRSCPSTQAKLPAMQLVAQVHDGQCGTGDAAGGWQTLLADRVANPGRHAVYDSARVKFVEHLKTNQAAQALAVKLPEPTALPLQLDAIQLRAEALLQLEKNAEAEALLTKTVAQASSQPYAAVQLALLLSDAQIRLGKLEAAAVTWRQTLETAADRLIADPIFWERASYLRPVEAAWPDAVARRLDQYHANGAHFAPNPEEQAAAPDENLKPQDRDRREAQVWGGIGQMRLDRREGQAALLAFKRADSLAPDLKLRSRLQLGQARALLELNQLPSAAAILVRLTGLSDTEVALPAVAMLGAVKMQKGSLEQGIALLQKAVTAEWSGRGDAEADLGLAYLSLGDETNGFQWLHSAQQRFERTNDHAALAQCLTNEMNYLNHKQKPEEAEKIRVKLAACP